MTKKSLNEYPALKKRREKLKNDIEDLKCRDIDVISGKVKGSMKEHPYIERSFTVEMEVPEEAGKVRDKIAGKEWEIKELEGKMREVEEFISAIPDVQIKTIFEYRYLEGMTQKEVGGKVGLDRSRVSRRIDNFLKTHTKHTKTML